MTLKQNKMKKIVIIFLLFSITTFAQKQNSKSDDQVSFEPNELVMKVDKIVKLTANQEERLLQHFKNKKIFFSNSLLSDSRRQAVLNAYKEEFDNILDVKQLTLFNKKNKSFYLYIATNY